jgi:hypothetical protein
MNPLIYAATALVFMPIVLVLLFLRLIRGATRPAVDEQRVVRLTAALELLTDTTEEGFVNVASELERLGARPLAPRSARRATTRRIAAAARKGRAIEDIAMAESLSESEVRLHLGLQAAGEPVTPREAGEEGSEGRGVLADVERWVNAASTASRPEGARHAAVRV